MSHIDSSFRNQIVLYFFIGSLSLLAILGIFYLLFHWRKKKAFRSFSIRTQIINLLIVSILAATSVAVIYILSQINPLLTVIPSIRISLEGILVKISGFLFGPIIGVIVAIVTEMVVLMFIPTYFYYKYLLVLMCFGLFSGLVRTFFNWKKRQSLHFLSIYFGLLIFMIFTLFFFYLDLTEKSTLSFKEAFTQTYLQKITFETFMFFGNLLAFGFLLGIVIFANLRMRKSEKDVKFLKVINKERVQNLVPVLLLTIFSEYLISVFIATNANQSVFGEKGDAAYILFSGALFIAPIKIIFNTIIIYNVWTSFQPYIKKKITF